MNVLPRPKSWKKKRKSLRIQKIMLSILTTKMLMAMGKLQRLIVVRSKSSWKIKSMRARLISHGPRA